MALRLIITVSKKVPGPAEYSSIQASTTIEGELVPGQDILAQAGTLQFQAEQAVDRFLNGQPGLRTPAHTSPASAQATSHSAHSASAVSAAPSRDAGVAVRPASSGSSRPIPAARRAPALATPSQLNFIRRLLDQGNVPLREILEPRQLASLDQLSCREAAQLIDQLKSEARA